MCQFGVPKPSLETKDRLYGKKKPEKECSRKCYFSTTI